MVQDRTLHDSLIDRVRWRSVEYLCFCGIPHGEVIVTPGDNGMITVTGVHGS
jgi:hypothetical protein